MRAHCFLDGAYLRKESENTGKPLVDPRQVGFNIAYSEFVQRWGLPKSTSRRTVGDLRRRVHLSRINYYDGLPDGGGSPGIEDYWKAIELLPETHLGFGFVKERRRGKKIEQKAVDVLLAVDLLEGSYNNLFEVAILVSGDADFVPAVRAAQRRGVMVVVAAFPGGTSEELKRSADRYWKIDIHGPRSDYPPLSNPLGGYWYQRKGGKIDSGQ